MLPDGVREVHVDVGNALDGVVGLGLRAGRRKKVAYARGWPRACAMQKRPP